jgi:hypothetical protein
MKKNHVVFLVTGLWLFGCGIVDDPHENFINYLRLTIGRSIETVDPISWPQYKDLLDSRFLPNGNVENRYFHQGTCKYILEFDPATPKRKIVGARYEGRDEDCVIYP